MKRIVLACMMIFLTLVAAQAKDLSDLMNEFKNEKRAEYVSVSPFVMAFARLFVPDDEEGGKFVRCIHSVRVLDLEDCSREVKQRFNREVEGINTSSYEEMMRVKEDGETVRIFVKQHKDIIREMLILCAGNDDCTLVALSGKIRPQDIQQIVEQQMKSNDKDER